MILLGLSFVAGVLTVLAPCILPLLPVIVGGSLGNSDDHTTGRNRVYVITASLGISVILCTLLLKVSTVFIAVSPFVWRALSGGIILVFGLITLFPSLWENQKFSAFLNRKSNQLLSSGYRKKSIWGDVIVGGALGPVFSTCSPTYFIVLATVLPESFAKGLLYLLTYTAGLCVSLLIIARIGQKIMKKLGIVADPRGWFKRIIGGIFVIVGLAVVLGFDKRLETRIISSGFFDITRVEQKLLEYNH